DESDTKVLVRALEVIGATGISLAEWQGTNAPPILDPSQALRIVVAPERESIYAAIDARFDRMLEEAPRGEVQNLPPLNLGPALPAMRALGVRELASCLAGRSSREDCIAKA